MYCYIVLFFISGIVYGAHNNLLVTAPTICGAPSYTVILPSRGAIRSTGEITIAASLIISTLLNNPIPYPANAILCCCGFAGLCVCAGAPVLESMRCTMPNCCPQCCSDEPLIPHQAETPTVPPSINV